MSWWQENPQTSLNFLHSFQLPKHASIIDIGGGDSVFVDYLLDEGFRDITVLDISQQALAKAQRRLGPRADKITWVCSDVLNFRPDRSYEVWHDRATFHFLNTKEEIEQYMHTAADAVTEFLTIGTFSDKGPTSCSGLPVHRYNEDQLDAEVRKSFEKIRCITEDHITPFNTHQNFLFCSFKRRYEAIS